MGSAKLPSFEAPPVIEVALGAQFQPISGLGIPNLGLLWQRFRDQYPRIEERPPLSHEIERLGVQSVPNAAQISLQMGGITPRIWMLTETGEELVQVQQDRLVTNWRKNAVPGAAYPRYESRKPDFIEKLNTLKEFASDSGLGDLSFDQCEVTYVNHIYPCEVWEEHKDLARVFRGWSSDYTLRDAEAISVKVRHRIYDEAGAFLGRLHIDLDSAYTRAGEKKEYTPIFALKLIARGKPTADGIDGVVGFLDIGHEAIVNGFTSITTPEMHRVWRKTR